MRNEKIEREETKLTEVGKRETTAKYANYTKKQSEEWSSGEWLEQEHTERTEVGRSEDRQLRAAVLGLVRYGGEVSLEPV